MPLTKFQKRIALLLAPNRSPDSHLAGGAALHKTPNSTRFSNDLDYFHDSEERVSKAFQEDRQTLEKEGFSVDVRMTQPGFIRAIVSDGKDSTKVEWSHDSAWRFMPIVEDKEVGYQLHPIDLAINKVLALAGRDEPRDFLDVLYVHKSILSLGALCWAAVGKDPGFTPLSLLSLIQRRGKYRPEDFSRLHLTKKVDLIKTKKVWLEALEEAKHFIDSRPPPEVGCLYYSISKELFVTPEVSGKDNQVKNQDADVVVHFGRPGGVLPVVKESQ